MEDQLTDNANPARTKWLTHTQTVVHHSYSRTGRRIDKVLNIFQVPGVGYVPHFYEDNISTFAVAILIVYASGSTGKDR